MPPLPPTCHSTPTIIAPLTSPQPSYPKSKQIPNLLSEACDWEACGLCCSTMNPGAQTHAGTRQILPELINQRNIIISVKASEEAGDRQNCLLHFAISVTAFHSLKNKMEPWPGAWLVGALPCTLKDCRFDSWSGHVSRFNPCGMYRRHLIDVSLSKKKKEKEKK